MANASDSVSIFAEGTYVEQIQELVLYIARNQSDEQRSASVAPFQEILKSEEGTIPAGEDSAKKKKVFEMVVTELKDLGDGSEKEIEGFFNLLYAHMFSVYSPETAGAQRTLSKLLSVISSSPAPKQTIKYRILSNLFNLIPRQSSLRHSVYKTLLAIASANDGIYILQLTKTDVERWLTEWEIPQNEKATFVKSIADAFAKSGNMLTSYEYSLLYTRFIPPSSSEAHAAAEQIVATALGLPNVFDFDALFKFEAVINLKNHNHELYLLLKVFINGGLPEFKTWHSNHPGSLEKYGLDQAELERKIRLLSLASLGFKSVGQNIRYSEIAVALQVDLAAVESWIIDVIRSGLLWGKMSQTSQQLHVIRATARTFEREQWDILEKRIVAWKSGLAIVLDVVANARKQTGYTTQASA